MLARPLLRRSFLHCSSFSTCKNQRSPSISPLNPPSPKKIPFAVSAHGRTWDDPYHWMSNASDIDLKNHLLCENSYADAFMSETDSLRKTLEAEMRARMPSKISTPPESWGNWLYYQYIPEEKEYPVLCRKPKNQNGYTNTLFNYLSECEEEVLLDWNEIAEQSGYVHIGTCRISPNHRFLAYTLDTCGSEMFTLYVKNLQTGQILSFLRREGVVSLAWAGDSSCLLYTVCNESRRPYRVFSTNLRSNLADDLLFTEDDLSYCVDIASTKDGKYITINSNSRSSSEIHIIDAMNLSDGVWPVRKRVPGVQYFLEHHHGFFYILTNALSEDITSTVSSYHLVRCQAQKSLLNDWQVVIQPDKDMLFQDMDIFNGHLVLSVVTKGLPLFFSLEMDMVVNHKHQKPAKLEDLKPWFFPLPISPCSILPGSNLDFVSSVYRMVISTPVMPDLVVDYDMKSRVFTIVHQEEVSGLIEHNKSSSDVNQHISGKQTVCKQHSGKERQKWVDLSKEFTCERRDVISHDGSRVPLTIVYSRRADHIGQSPGILYGYGAYGEVLEKSFSSDNISLLSRGWVIGYADVRGGGRDSAWHKAGTRHCKLNSIYDFAESAKFLLTEGYVNKNQLGAIGCSAGGLLVAATINMFPDLFSTAILKVPYLDICNTLLDPSLPLTNLDYDEFGDPRIRADFEFIQSYSPYDNICLDACYPTVLVTASYNDTRVGVWEAAKWVAKVRDKTCQSCSQSVILKTNMAGGHFAEGGRYAQSQDAAFEYAFLIKAMGLLDDNNY